MNMDHLLVSKVSCKCRMLIRLTLIAEISFQLERFAARF